MTKKEKNPFYWLRELFQDALGLALPTDKLKVMALLLVRRADEDYFARTGEIIAWIGADNLAKALKCNRRTVQRGLLWLLEQGVVTKWEKGGGRKRSTRYCFSKQWLGMMAPELEKSGQAEAYGLPNDLFTFADGYSLTAVSGQFSGLETANGAGDTEAAGQNYGVRTANRGQNSGEGARVSANYGHEGAVSAENSGQFSGSAEDTAASEADNCGLADQNCGPIRPPEIDLNNRNRGAPVRNTATPMFADRNQGHIPFVFSGGLAASSESHGYPVDEPWLSDLLRRAGNILGDRDQASLAVDALPDTVKERLRDGSLQLSDADMESWLRRSLNSPVAKKVRERAAPKVRNPEDRLGRVELMVQQSSQQSAEALQLVRSVQGQLAELNGFLRLLTGGSEKKSAVA